MGERQELSGWAGTPRSATRVVSPGTSDALTEAMSCDGTVIARGLGRSYGDAAQNAGGSVVVTTEVATVELDAERGILRVDAGASIARIHELTVPAGWFLPVVPGTRFVTVGGAIAADVHGKNHHRAGSFGDHVASIRMVLGTGEVVEAGPDRDAELFWATVGGMGLTGTVLSAEIRLTAIESSDLVVATRPTADLDATMAVLEAADAVDPYTVAWIDATAPPARIGRGLVERARFATARESGTRDVASRAGLAAPTLPTGVLASTASLANRAWYHLGARRGDRTRGINAFFHPLDAVARWNRLYGPSGFVQWQMVVPTGAEEVMARCVAAFGAAREPVVLAVLKRFGPGGPGLLSFPIEGWTLAVDLPAHRPTTAMLLDRLDRLVAEAGGRIYLAKDSRLDPALVPAMYPRLDEWREIRRRADPDDRLRSDLSRRLRL